MFVILEKKKIINLLGICICLFTIGSICISSINKNNDIIPTSSKAKKEKVVILDAGHGQPDRTVLLALQELAKKV